eukprot:TRINITY_DN10983_c0_g1_i1.p3 TRINITY_DN10983_c0_g1~~TRINITY_DN10983_c0_g1_i1.p3  ORF type:complete len:112 (+),score=16.41 TRINITY_DN10983_c0_g1_i1:147-482(+)
MCIRDRYLSLYSSNSFYQLKYYLPVISKKISLKCFYHRKVSNLQNQCFLQEKLYHAFSILQALLRIYQRHLSTFQRKADFQIISINIDDACLLYTSPSPRDRQKSRMPSSA